MAGGPHAAVVPCVRCAARAERTFEGIETDSYLCRSCAFDFAIDWAADGGPPSRPRWPVAMDDTELRSRAENVPVWIVWYEDRFGWGADRDPPSVVAVHATEADAQAHVQRSGGPPDIESGRYDGCFSQRWKLADALDRRLVDADHARALVVRSELTG